jgi:hypothetical protein
LRNSIGLARQASSLGVNELLYGIYGVAIHLLGFVLGLISIGLIDRHIDIESGLAKLMSFAATLYGLDL